MKKIILIFSLIVTIFGIFLLALPSLLNWTGLAQPVKRYLLSSAEENLPYSINLDNFKIGLGTLRFNNVALKSDNKRFKLTLNSIRLSYRLTSLLIHPKSPLRSLENITLVNPQLIIRQSNPVRSPKKSTDIWKILQSLINRLNKKNTIKFVRIEDGQVAIHRANTDSILIVRHLNGILKSDGENLIDIGLSGSFLSDKPDQMDISARINLKNEKVRLLCRLANYQVQNEFIENFFPNLTFRTGNISGWILFENQHFNPDSIRLNGELRFRNFNLSYRNRDLRNLEFKAAISNNRLVVDSLRGKFARSDFAGKMWIANMLKPTFQAVLQFSGLHLRKAFANEQTHWYSDASIAGKIFLTVNPATASGTIELKDGKFRFPSGRSLDAIKAKMSFSPDSIRLPVIYAQMGNENTVKGTGYLNRHNGQVRIHLKAKHLTSTHLIFDRLSQKTHILDLQLSSNIENGKIKGNWAYSLASAKDTILSVNGDITGNKQDLWVNIIRSNAAGFNALLHINNYLRNPRIEKGIIENFPLQKFTTAEFLLPVLKRTHSLFAITGPLNRLKFNLKLTDRTNLKNQIEIVATLSNLFTSHRVLNGLMRLKNITGNTKMTFSDSYYSGNFRFGNQLSGTLEVDFKNKQYLNGQIQFNHFNIVQAFSDSVIANNFHFLGNINGRVLLHGDIHNPLLSANLTGDRFVFNDVGYYQAGIQLLANKDSIDVDSLFIAINNLPVIQGKGNIDLAKRTVKGAFSGNNVDIEQVLTTLNPRGFHISGAANYSLVLNGKLQQPKIDLNVTIDDGTLDRIDFDHLSVRLQNAYIDGGTIFHTKDQVLKIDRLEISRRDHFQLTGLGQIPLYSTGNIDLFLNFDGDLLSLIPLYQPFFEKGVSDVNLHLAFGGTPERIRLSSGLMVINRGELWLQNIAPHIQNISGVIEKKSGSNKVNIVNFTASAGGQSLTINTVRNVTLADGRHLSPWYFKGLDLDFGVLQMETTGRGIQLHLPGFMRPKDFGRLALSGEKPNEKFYFAGPVKHPLAHGKVTIYDTRLTFPFLTMDKAPTDRSDAVLEFLENIDWDLWVTSGEDVVYFREIPAYIDNVNTELFVDESSPGLHLRGVLSNNTFRVSGKVSSSRGRLEYLDQTFRVDYFQAEFTEASPYPFISGQAWTTIRDSIGAMPKTIYLKLYAVDPETHQEKQQGSLENFKFKLVSADPQIGEDQERVLSYLGFSVGNLREKATSVGGAVTDKYIFRPLFRPIERAIERNLGIDFVRINSNIAKNLFYTSIGYGGRNFGRNQPLINPFNTTTPYLFLMSSSEVTLGKYLTQNLYLTYTGQLVSVYDKTKPTFDMNHSFGIEYRFLRNILLEIEYDRELMGYYKIPNQKQYLEDIKIRLRHSFTF